MLVISGLQRLWIGLNNTIQKSIIIFNPGVNRCTVLCNDFSTSDELDFFYRSFYQFSVNCVNVQHENSQDFSIHL